MLEEILTNTFIGIEKKNDEYLLQSIDLSNNIKQHSLSDIFSNINTIKSLKTKIIISTFHNVEYFKDNIKDINMDEIEERFKNIENDYNKVICALEKKIKDFKKGIETQILLVKKIIELYNSSIKSDKITYQIIMNTKNILKFNPIKQNEFFPDEGQINLDYDFLQPFPIDNIINENITIQNIEKNTIININKEDKFSSLLFIEYLDKLLYYNEKKIILFNLKNFMKESEIKTKDSIISLNLMKDKIIYIGFSQSIKKLEIKNNKIEIIDFLDNNIYLYKPGKIIKYKESLAWTNSHFIGFVSEDYYDINDQLHIEFNSWSGYYKSMLLDIMEYKNNNIIYLYSLEYIDHHGEGYFYTYLGSYNKNLSKGEQINLGYIDYNIYRGYTGYLTDHFKLTSFKKNEIMVLTTRNVFIINIKNWEIKEKISLPPINVNNSYCLKDKCFLFLYDNYYNNKLKNNKKINNIIFMKIDDNNNKILYETNIKLNNYSNNLYYFKKNNRDYLVVHNNFDENNYEEITFYELINMEYKRKLNYNII